MAYKLDYEEGMGIRGMREKIQRIGGTFAILPEEGFLIRLTFTRSGDFSMD
jgi:signal transduction histidine kinase